MKFRFIFYLLLIAKLALSQDSVAFQYAVINTETGLPTNNIVDCIRDTKGFLWISLEQGVIRYAQKNSIYFKSDPQTGKPLINRGRLLLKDSILFIGGHAGLYMMNIHTLKLVKVNGFSDVSIEDLALYKDNVIMCTRDGQIILYNLSRKTVKRLKICNRILVDILVKGDDLFCIGINRGLFFRFNLATLTLMRYSPLIPTHFTDQLALASNGDIYLASSDRFKRYNQLYNRFDAMPDFPFRTTAYSAISDTSHVFIERLQKIYYQERNGLKVILDPPVDRQTSFKRVIKGDNDEFFLLSTQGLIIVRKFYPFKKIPVFSDSISEVRRAIVEDTQNKKIFYFSYLHVSVFNKEKGGYEINRFPSNVHAAYLDQDDFVVTTESGTLLVVDKKTLIPKQYVYDKREPHQFISLGKLAKGQYLIGGMVGLYWARTDGVIRKINLKTKHRDYSNEQVRAIWIQPNGDIWLGGSFGILVLNAQFKLIDQYSTFAKGDHTLPVDAVNCLYGNKNGVYAGLDGELVFIPFTYRNVNLLYTPVFGQNTNRIIGIVEDAFQDIWFSTYQGIYRYNPGSKEIRAFRAPYYFSNDEFNRSSALSASNGKLYFGSVVEHIEIDPSLYRSRSTPIHLQFNQVRIFGSQSEVRTIYSINNNDTLKMPIEGSSLDISFISNELISSEKVKYQYRIINVDPNWVDLDNRSSLQLFSLPPGEQHLQIRVISFDGGEPNTLSLFILTPALFYKTIWFYLFILFSLLLFGYFIYWYRLRHLKRMLHFRKELSNDLHDMVGTAVTKSIYAAQAIINESKAKDERLDQIIEYGKQIHYHFRDVLFSLEENKFINLIDRIHEIGHKAIEHTGFSFILRKGKINPNALISQKHAREILMIAREALHNAIKYSQGDQICFEFFMKQSKLHLVIYDNGKNDNETLEFRGLGLESIQRRMKKINGKVQFQKKKDGFFIHIEF